LHGGSIAAQSEPGRGTRFEIRIPTGSAHLPADRVAAAAPAGSPNPITAAFVDEAARWLPAPWPDQDAVQGAHGPGGRPVAERVLVVDDNADMREYLRQLLHEWDVTSVGDGRAALELARANPPGLIVTDVMMPELDGFGLLRELRSDTRTRAVPVLMISARAGEEARVSGLDAGADDYIIKPFSARELRARVNSLLNLSRARRDAELQKVAAEAANRSKDQFLAILGHELRNPLAPILTALQLMSLRSDRSNLKERAVIDRQVRHLMRLVDDLLDISRIARGKIELRHQTLDMADMVANAIEATSPLLEQRHHVLKVSVPEGLVVRGDATRLAQVVVNVLSNAAKYTEPHGEIRVEARRDGGQIALHIADSGSGISADMLPHIFEMFAQERQSLDRSRGGLGLGLTIVKSLVELHEGTVEAHSAGAGQGSEFVVRLPAAAAPLSDEPAVLAASPGRSPISGGRRILVVDDNVDAAKLLAEALQIVGHDTRVAFDGPDALAAAADFQPHAALIDLGLPLMDGYELARQMIAAGDGQRPPILIAVTGYGQVADRENSQAAGFDMHIIKPVDVAKLISVLDGLFVTKPASS
jgi:signal transduction histidine kinase